MKSIVLLSGMRQYQLLKICKSMLKLCLQMGLLWITVWFRGWNRATYLSTQREKANCLQWP